MGRFVWSACEVIGLAPPDAGQQDQNTDQRGVCKLEMTSVSAVMSGTDGNGKVQPPERVYERRSSISEHFQVDVASQGFNWREGRFVSSSVLPVWMQLCLHGILCLLLLIVPTVIYRYGFISTPYPLIAAEPPAKPHFSLELVRWVLLFAWGYLGFFLTNLFAYVMVHVVYYFYSLRSQEVPQQIRRMIDHLLVLRVYACWFVASTILVFASSQFFPLTKAEAAMQLFKFEEVEEEATAEATAEMMKGLVFADYFREYGSSHSIQFLVNRGAAALLVYSGLVLCEKMIIQRIAYTFYYRSFGERIANNSFAMKTTKKLRALIVQKHPELADAEIVSVVFRGIEPNDSKIVTASSFIVLIPEQDATRYFELIDAEGTGEMSKEQFTRSISYIFEEAEDLRLGMLDQSNVITKLDNLFMVFTVFCVGIIWMALFQVSWQLIVAALGGIGAILLFVSSGTIKTAFESIIFVIFTHPFDVGDQVIIDDRKYLVKELGLWSSTFQASDNRITYIANSQLSEMTIVNTRRSPFQIEQVEICVLPTTPAESLALLESKIQDFLRQNIRDYVPMLAIKNIVIVDKNNLRLEISLKHRGNFQDGDLKDIRSRKFLLHLRDAVQECGIEFSPPYYKKH